MEDFRPTDGYIARYDRALSGAVTKVLLPFPVTPNAITTACLFFGLWGAWALASGSPRRQLAGAALLWFCAILDGCDGEVARLKNQSTRFGAAYDEASDHLANLAVFIAIPLGVHRLHPQMNVALPGALLVSGVAISAAAVWALVLHAPRNLRERYPLIIERLASRDFVYLILLACALGHLEWFLWAAAVGSHLFYVGLGLAALRARHQPA